MQWPYPGWPIRHTVVVDDGERGAMASYRLEGAPTSVDDEGSGPLPSHYVAEFTTASGERVRRYLTDRGRAAVLRRMDGGQIVFSPDEVRDFTVEPDIDALVARMQQESGEGA